ncbi:CHAT domain-containing protein [Streptomyces winkii]|uniref:CHAT domain-containing protein n=1 Tax=Streptomyces winkii TaxID=3051178 RepID=UPI0028D82540|nr:CHAT domain-containing protein [Streptomyces sp. DSM 40971]
MEISADHPALPAVRRAEKRYEQGDAAGCDAEFAKAEQLARRDPRLWGELAVHHVSRLVGLRDLRSAGSRCDAYLGRVAVGPERTRLRGELRVLRAEILADGGRSAAAARESEDARHELLVHGGSLSTDDEARLLRVQGVAAGEEGDGARARLLLERSRELFARLGDDDAAARIERELDRLGVLDGDQDAARKVADAGRDADPADEFVRGMALKLLCRYEEALHTMVGCALREDLSAERRWPVLREIALLLRALGQDETADRLKEQLTETAARADDRSRAEAELARLLHRDAPSDGTFMGELQHALRLLAPAAPRREKLRAAEQIIVGVRDRADSEHECAVWHLAAGELELKLAQADRDGPDGPDDRDGRGGEAAGVRDAMVHLELAIDRAERCSRIEVRVQALRLLGRAYYHRSSRPADGSTSEARSTSADGSLSGGNSTSADGSTPDGDLSRARECWNEARRLEEGITALQETDKVRREMSLTIADTTDEWIASAVAAGRHLSGANATAALLVAMEAARGASILAEILPGASGSVRALPRPGDHDGARAWAGEIALRLPHSRTGSQAVWLMHAGTDHIHHAVLSWDECFRVSVPCRRDLLKKAIDEFAGCWSSEEILELSLENDDFGQSLDTVARLMGVAQVLGRLPEHVRRIAVVAGGMLAEVPLGAVATEGGEPLGIRYALSDLPCLSALAPLRRRGHRTRGFSRLVVSPRPEGTARPARVSPWEKVVDEARPPEAASKAVRRPRRRLMLLDRHATPEALGAALSRRRHRLVRIYSHGKHHHTDSGRSKLQLAPEGPDGAVLTDELQQMDLRRCGTLVLGACESGMAQLVGGDERTGFVRAAFVAGAASAVAARWVAPAHVAAELLDRFESYARHQPRDVALQLAQRDVYSGAAGEGVLGTRGQDPRRTHFANWACWTLYGDSGFQTRADPVTRRLRSALREFTTRRRHAGPR